MYVGTTAKTLHNEYSDYVRLKYVFKINLIQALTQDASKPYTKKPDVSYPCCYLIEH